MKLFVFETDATFWVKTFSKSWRIFVNAFQSATLEAHRLSNVPNVGNLEDADKCILHTFIASASSICKTPIAFLSLADVLEEGFVASQGLEEGFARQQTLDAFLLPNTQTLIVKDLTQDPHFKHHPWVIGPPYLQFYAGYALRTPTGQPVGYLAVLDTRSRRLLASQRKQLEYLVRQAEAYLSLLHDKIHIQRALQRYQTAVDCAQIGIWEATYDRSSIWLSPQMYRLLGFEPDDPSLDYPTLAECIHPEDRPTLTSAQRQFEETGELVHCLLRLAIRSQGYHWFAVRQTISYDAEHPNLIKRIGSVANIDGYQQSRLEFERFYAYQERLNNLSFDLGLSQEVFLQAGIEILCEYYGFTSGSVTRVQGGGYEILAVQNTAPLVGGQAILAG